MKIKIINKLCLSVWNSNTWTKPGLMFWITGSMEPSESANYRSSKLWPDCIVPFSKESTKFIFTITIIKLTKIFREKFATVVKILMKCLKCPSILLDLSNSKISMKISYNYIMSLQYFLQQIKNTLQIMVKLFTSMKSLLK